MSIPPNCLTAASTAFWTWISFRTSTAQGRHLPPAASTTRSHDNQLTFQEESITLLLSSAAVKIVPGNFGWGSVVLAAMMMLAPSLAAFNAMALPIPRLAPVIKRVRPANFLKQDLSSTQINKLLKQSYPVFNISPPKTPRICKHEFQDSSARDPCL